MIYTRYSLQHSHSFYSGKVKVGSWNLAFGIGIIPVLFQYYANFKITASVQSKVRRLGNNQLKFAVPRRVSLSNSIRRVSMASHISW